MDAIEGDRAPKKKARRGKRKAVDPTFKPRRGDSGSDSDSDFDLASTPSIRRQNPPRSASTNDGIRRVNYSETRSATSSSSARKRQKTDKPTNELPFDTSNNGTNEIEIHETPSLPLAASPTSENGKPEGEGKTSWFFSRMLQSMKNFWTKNDATATNTSERDNDQMDYTQSSQEKEKPTSNKVASNGTNNSSKRKSSSSDSSKETLAYDSKDSNTIVPGSNKKTRIYYYNEAWHIPAEELEILETISSGTFGDVSRARWRGSEVAVKTLRTPSPHVGDKILNLFLKEVSILSKLRHPSIVLFMGASITPKLCIVMEYHPKGSLYNLLHVQKEVIPYKQVIEMAKQIAEGLNYLHLCSPKIIHRDVKSSNILVTASRSVKIADFGISKETTAGSDSTMTGFMGTSSYMSPEMVRGVKYTEKVDVYSFGILLWEMYSHKVPFRSMHALQVAHKVLQGERPPISDKCPSNLAALLKSCWHETPAERPSFKDIVQSLNNL